MLQVDLRINGVLVDCIDIVNTGTILEIRNATENDYDCLYTVNRINTKGKTEVVHNRKDGAIKLAALALTAISKKERK